MPPRRGWRFSWFGFYKDFAPDGAVLQTRLNLLHSHLTLFAGKFIFNGVKPALRKTQKASHQQICRRAESARLRSDDLVDALRGIQRGLDEMKAGKGKPARRRLMKHPRQTQNSFSKIMNDLTQSRWLPIVLLTCSNVFMTFAWYGHLKFKSKPLLLVILASWGIAFFEYLLQVPANRWGNSVYSATQLKIIQESHHAVGVRGLRDACISAKKSGGITSRRSCASWRRWRSPFCRRSDYKRRGNES